MFTMFCQVYLVVFSCSVTSYFILVSPQSLVLCYKFSFFCQWHWLVSTVPCYPYVSIFPDYVLCI